MYNAFKYTKLLAVVVVLSALCRSCTAAEESSGTGIKLSTSAQLVLAVCLICFSALFAGLTLGIMGCDTTTLEIIADSGDEPDKTYAKAILPVRRLGHQSLCTLVLGNMFTNVVIAEMCTDVDPGGSGGGFAAFLAFVTVHIHYSHIHRDPTSKHMQVGEIAANCCQGRTDRKSFHRVVLSVCKAVGNAAGLDNQPRPTAAL